MTFQKTEFRVEKEKNDLKIENLGNFVSLHPKWMLI